MFTRKDAADPEIAISVMKKGDKLESHISERLSISGLDSQRMRYLYE